VISAGPGEESIAKEVAAGIAAPAAVYDSGAGLESFARTLQLADLFISGSTGPLHVAAALDRPTAAFYPRHRSATPLRWQTTNAPEKRLAFVPPDTAALQDVQLIDLTEAAHTISSSLLGG
jgi:ADP-heptose:LPS heptosyltransferase